MKNSKLVSIVAGLIYITTIVNQCSFFLPGFSIAFIVRHWAFFTLLVGHWYFFWRSSFQLNSLSIHLSIYSLVNLWSPLYTLNTALLLGGQPAKLLPCSKRFLFTCWCFFFRDKAFQFYIITFMFWYYFLKYWLFRKPLPMPRSWSFFPVFL